MIRPSLPIKCLFLIFDNCDLRPGHFRDLPSPHLSQWAKNMLYDSCFMLQLVYLNGIVSYREFIDVNFFGDLSKYHARSSVASGHQQLAVNNLRSKRDGDIASLT